MSELNVLTFELSKKIDPKTKKPYGNRFAGEFIVRRPTIEDKQKIALIDAGHLSFHNVSEASMVSDSVLNMNYIQAFFTVCGEKVPDWFDLGSLYEEDRPMVILAFQEVSQWLNTFRSKGTGE